MTRRPLVFLTCLAAAGRSMAPASAHHQREEGETFRVDVLAGDVYALFGEGGNVAFHVGPESVLIVDSQFEELAPGIVDRIRRITDKPIRCRGLVQVDLAELASPICHGSSRR